MTTIGALALSTEKWQLSTPLGAKTPEMILMKLGMVQPHPK